MLEARRKKKNGLYDIEPVEKLKEKGYNLFQDITDAYGHQAEFMIRSPNVEHNDGSDSRHLRKAEPMAIPRSFLKVDESMLKKGKKSKFFKEFHS